MDNNILIQEYNKLETTQEKRLFVLKHATNSSHRTLLEYKKLSFSTIDILFRVLTNQKIEYKENYFTNKKR